MPKSAGSYIYNKYTWEKLYKTTQLTYNPIWNVDANEVETFSQGRHKSTEYNSTDEQNYDSELETGYDSTLETTYDSSIEKTLDLTDVESVKGFNSSSWSEAKKLEKDGTDTDVHSGSDTDTRSGKDTVTHSGKDTLNHRGGDTETENLDNTLTKTRSGNIGVTTTQKMIKEERETAEFNMINYITMSFKERFCLLVY